jgi:hypothetical protein
MADQAGCTISELISRFSAFELNLRITNRLIKEGYIFDPQKIAEMKRKKKDEEVEAFLQRARAYWGK